MRQGIQHLQISCGRRDSFTLKDLKEVSVVVKRVLENVCALGDCGTSSLELSIPRENVIKSFSWPC